jgi:hypothetical protein
MTTDKRLTEEEAEEFLELYEAVRADMDDAFEDVAGTVFGDEHVDVAEKWGLGSGELYAACTRRKVRKFVEHAYLDED